jgi:hypothetical protein
MAAWLGRTLDASEFALFPLSMLPISRELGVPLTAVTASFNVILWVRAATPLRWLERQCKVLPPDLEIIK